MNWDDLTNRIDAKFYALYEPLKSAFPLRQLGALVSAEPDYGSSSRAVRRTSEELPRYIRITDFGEDGIAQNHEFATADPIDWRYKLNSDDVLFARSGATVGKTYLHEDSSVHAIFAGYCIRFRFDESKVSPRFVYWWTKTESYSKWVAAVQRPSGQPNINKEEFKSCPIPLPSIRGQGELIAQMDAARAERKAKLTQADALLSGIDDFLLNALGITPLPSDSRRAFAVSLAEARAPNQKRLNPDYYHPERIGALRTLNAASHNLKVAHLSEVAGFVRNKIPAPSENYLSLAHIESHTGELADATDTASGGCFTFQTDDVLFARLRPYLNKVYHAEMNGCCSLEFRVLRVRDRDALLPEYLAAVIRSRLTLSQTIHMMAGNTHPSLPNDDVADLAIPIPAVEVQETIVAEIRRRRAQARRLRAEAEAVWQSAKRRFEERLLGAAAPNGYL